MFKDKIGTQILSNDIMWDVMDEVRTERKVLMVLRNDNVDTYVNLEMETVDMLNYKDDSSVSFDVKLACDEKVRFRKRMAVEKIGILRLDYIYRVMRKVYKERASIIKPEAFKSKIRSLEREDKKSKLKRTQSGASVGSMSGMSKTQTDKSSQGGDNKSDGGSGVNNA